MNLVTAISGKNGIEKVFEINPYQTMDCGLSAMPEPDKIIG